MTRNMEATLATRWEMLAESDSVLGQVLRRTHGRTISDDDHTDIVSWALMLDINLGLSKNTTANYIDYVAQFVEWLGDQDTMLDEATRQDIETWQQQLYTHHKQQAPTRSLKLTALRQFFAWRTGQGKGIDPTAGIRGPRKPKRVPRKFTDNQIRRLMETCDLKKPIGLRDYAVLMLVFTTGARRNEVALLDVNDLALKQRTGAVRLHGKGNKERVLTFGQPTSEALQAWLMARDSLALKDLEAVFVATGHGSTGTRLSQRAVYNIVTRAMKKACMKGEKGMALHTLRSSFATTMYDLDYKIEDIALMMGHESVETTRGYIVITNKHARSRMPDNHVAQVTGNRLRTQQ